jgi:pimeloyl-ACP methyl ester carboxylesterase
MLPNTSHPQIAPPGEKVCAHLNPSAACVMHHSTKREVKMALTATGSSSKETSAPASTEVIVVSGVNVAIRSVGDGEPVVLLNRFRGTLDTWDPAFVAALATTHRIVMFDSLGVGETAGDTPNTVESMADFAERVIEEMELRSPTVFGWSLGGFVAQILAIKAPRLIGKLILAGTMPPRGAAEAVWSEQWLQAASNPVPSIDSALSLLFTESAASRSAGRASFGRLPTRPAAIVSSTAIAAQARAIRRFADNDDGWYARLREIIAPTLVANGDRDGLFPAIDSAVLAREIARSRLSIYADSGHGFLFQYFDRFSADVLEFLREAPLGAAASGMRHDS